jgi:PAS domain S-box-containing protein
MEPSSRPPAGAGLGLSVEALLDASRDAVVAVDGGGRIVYANPAIDEVFGWHPRDVVDRQVEFLIPERLGDEHVARRAQFWREPNARPMGTGLELTARGSDGLEFPVEVSLVPVGSTNRPIVFATIIDITSRVSVRRALLG